MARFLPIKIVRDDIPGLRDGQLKLRQPKTAQEVEAAVKRLQAKLLEETVEYVRDPSMEELADIYEIICVLLDVAHHKRLGDLLIAAQLKREARGSFMGLITLGVEVD